MVIYALLLQSVSYSITSANNRRIPIIIVIVDEHEKTVEYLSQTYEGTRHDRAICDDEQYEFSDNSTLQKDRGFQGYEPENVITYQPKKKPQNGALSTLDRR